jgi:hypothetical protein
MLAEGGGQGPNFKKRQWLKPRGFKKSPDFSFNEPNGQVNKELEENPIKDATDKVAKPPNVDMKRELNSQRAHLCLSDKHEKPNSKDYALSDDDLSSEAELLEDMESAGDIQELVNAATDDGFTDLVQDPVGCVEGVMEGMMEAPNEMGVGALAEGVQQSQAGEQLTAALAGSTLEQTFGFVDVGLEFGKEAVGTTMAAWQCYKTSKRGRALTRMIDVMHSWDYEGDLSTATPKEQRKFKHLLDLDDELSLSGFQDLWRLGVVASLEDMEEGTMSEIVHLRRFIDVPLQVEAGTAGVVDRVLDMVEGLCGGPLDRNVDLYDKEQREALLAQLEAKGLSFDRKTDALFKSGDILSLTLKITDEKLFYETLKEHGHLPKTGHMHTLVRSNKKRGLIKMLENLSHYDDRKMDMHVMELELRGTGSLVSGLGFFPDAGASDVATGGAHAMRADQRRRNKALIEERCIRALDTAQKYAELCGTSAEDQALRNELGFLQELIVGLEVRKLSDTHIKFCEEASWATIDFVSAAATAPAYALPVIGPLVRKVVKGIATFSTAGVATYERHRLSLGEAVGEQAEDIKKLALDGKEAANFREYSERFTGKVDQKGEPFDAKDLFTLELRLPDTIHVYLAIKHMYLEGMASGNEMRSRSAMDIGACLFAMTPNNFAQLCQGTAVEVGEHKVSLVSGVDPEETTLDEEERSKRLGGSAKTVAEGAESEDKKVAKIEERTRETRTKVYGELGKHFHHTNKQFGEAANKTTEHLTRARKKANFEKRQAENTGAHKENQPADESKLLGKAAQNTASQLERAERRALRDKKQNN